MVEQIIYTDGKHTKTGERLILKRFTKDVAKRLYMAWTNPQAFRYNDIPEINMNDENEWDCVGDIADYGFPSDFGMYFMSIFRINPTTNTEELIGNCRFGKCPYEMYKDKDDVWDFGFSIIRDDDKLEYSDEEIKKAFMSEKEQSDTGIPALEKDKTYWGQGYITEVIATILEIAKQEGIKKVVSGADIHNLGSCKAQVKCGMKLARFDDDHDPEFEIDIDKNYPLIFPTQEEIDKQWDYTTEEIQKVLNNENIKKDFEDYRIKKLEKALFRNRQRYEYREKHNSQSEQEM